MEEDNFQDDSSSTGYRLADLKILEHIICLACTCIRKICRNSTLVVKETKRAGLASVISVTCCTDGCDLYLEHPLVPKTNPYFYVCSRCSVLAPRTISRSHSGLQRLCDVMNLPPPVTKAASAIRGHSILLQRVLLKRVCRKPSQRSRLSMRKRSRTNSLLR